MLYIYARTSTEKQNVEQQVKELTKKYNADQVFTDQVTGSTLDRPEFKKLLSVIKPMDSIIVQDLSRIGRNTIEVLSFVDDMQEQGVSLIVDDLGKIDITSSAGKMVLTTLTAVATMQREQMLEKQAIGIIRAKGEGKFKGKQQTQATVDKCNKAIKLINENGLSKEHAALSAKIGVATLYRFIKEQK